MKENFNMYCTVKGKPIFFFFIGLCYFVNVTAQTNAPVASTYRIAAEDGTWCWYADPRAVYYKAKQERIYYGYINSKGDVVISARDMRSKVVETFVLHEKLQIDDHNVPSILFLPDGKILTFYTEHNGRFFMRKSKNSEDISAWEEERVLTFGLKDRICYSNPVMLSDENNRIYMFFRSHEKQGKEVNWKQNYAFSDDLGETWSNAQSYLNSGGSYNKIPYLKIVSDNKSKIHFLFTDGHPKLGLSSVYHMYYEKGKFHQTGGEPIAAFTETPLDIARINKLYDSDKGKTRSWIWDIALDKKGYPVVAYARYPSVSDHIYHYARWDGRQWQDQELLNSGGYITKPEKSGKVLEEHYSGGVVLDHHHPQNVFLSRQVNGVFEIEHWQLKGRRWNKKAVTANSSANNIRPYVVDGYTGKPILMWMNGTYEHYVRYKTDLLINEKK